MSTEHEAPHTRRAHKEDRDRIEAAQPQRSEQEWECPDCHTRYIKDVGRCGELRGCSRPNVVPASGAASSENRPCPKCGYISCLDLSAPSLQQPVKPASVAASGTAAVATSEPQEQWTPEQVAATLKDRPFAASTIASHHNAAIAAERERRKKSDADCAKAMSQLREQDDFAVRVAIKPLVEALEKARATIAVLHGTEPWDGWDIYVKHSPEMKQIDAALERAKEQP